MFERVKVDNISPIQTVAVPAEVTLDDHSVLRGKFITPQGRALPDLLNGAIAFVEFEPYGGERRLFAKSSIRSVKIVNVPGTGQLARRHNEIDTFDPYAVLGIKSGAPFDEVKTAYHRLAKIYHPDRYSAAELPPEVREYLAAMVRRINAAFSALEAPHQMVKKSTADRAEAVYTSRPRA
jgi:hypothetical protein